jgi:hypothetical protein
VAAHQQVASSATGDRVGDTVVARVGLVRATGIQLVTACPALEPIAALTTDDGFPAEAADNVVGTVTALGEVDIETGRFPAAKPDDVVAGPAADGVSGSTARDDVFPTLATELIAPGTTSQHVVCGGANDAADTDERVGPGTRTGHGALPHVCHDRAPDFGVRCAPEGVASAGRQPVVTTAAEQPFPESGSPRIEPVIAGTTMKPIVVTPAAHGVSTPAAVDPIVITTTHHRVRAATCADPVPTVQPADQVTSCHSDDDIAGRGAPHRVSPPSADNGGRQPQTGPHG